MNACFRSSAVRLLIASVFLSAAIAIKLSSSLGQTAPECHWDTLSMARLQYHHHSDPLTNKANT
jgi:hypothetical protein